MEGENMQSNSGELENLHLDGLQDFSCGVCVIDIRNSLSIIFANQAFYQTLNTNAEEMRLRYGDCLETLLSGKNIRQINKHLKEKKSFEMEVCVKNSIFIQCMFNCAHIKEKSLVYMICFDMTAYKQKSEKFDSLVSKLDYIYSKIKCDVFEYEKETSVVSVSSSKVFFDEPSEGLKVPDYFFNTYTIMDKYIKDINQCFQLIKNGDENATCEFKLQLNEKGEKWIRIILDTKSTEPGHVLCVLIDISAEKEATTKYFQEMLFYHAILSDRDAYGHFDITDDRVLIMGGLWNLYNEVIKRKTYSEIFNEFIDKVVHVDDRQHYKETMRCDTIIDSYNKGIMHMGCEFRRIVTQNKMVWMKISIHIIKNPLNQHIMALMYIKNIDHEKKRLLELTFRDENDALTGIYNKKALDLKVKEYILLRNIRKNNILVIVDIDDLKIINKRHGFTTGDNILKSIADNFVKTFNKDDIIGRFGGDEFLLLLKDSEDTEAVIEKIEAVEKKVQKQFKVMVTFCMGVTIVDGVDSYEYAFQKVVSALMEAKNKGRNKTFVYKKELLDKNFKYIQERNLKEYEDTFLKQSNVNLFQDKIDEVMGLEGEIAYIVDPNSLNLLCGNQVFYDRLGKSSAQCIGKKCYELMHKRNTPCPFCKKENWSDEKFFMYRDFNKVLEQEFLIKNKLIMLQNRTLLLAIAVDLSNKTIVDSIDHGTTENNHLLNGIEGMQESSSLEEAFTSALETIFDFFRARSVRFWNWNKEEDGFYLNRKWSYPQGSCYYTKQECQHISDWLKRQTNKKKLVRIESQEFMLCESAEVYQSMKRNNVENQVWYILSDGDEMIGFIEIDSVSINYQNDTFLKSFINFLESEWRKRKNFDEIIYNNYYDKLTGLKNRNSYDEFIRHYDKEKIENLSVIFMNLNQMTEINNENGTMYGDNVIIEFSKIIAMVCKNAYIFRLNGDEFMIVNFDVEIQDVEKQVKRIEEMIRERVTFTASIGYSWDNIEKDFNKQVTIATQTMEIHKQGYYDSLENKGDNHHEELSMLINCIENHEFQVFLQAKVNSQTGIIFGAEALIRFIHKDFGVITPGKFIPLVEKRNMIRYIDLFVFEEVCKCLDKWKKEGLFCPVISLNFSRKTLLEDHLIDIMNETVNKYHIDKKNIEIEITEGDAEVGATVVYQIVSGIRKAGYFVSLDDFGTNYTNLNILSELDFDTLKLDRSLIYSLDIQKKNRIILKSILQMCKQLGVEVVAEGVETLEQKDILTDLGCIYIQGYLYSKPIPIVDFEEQFIHQYKKVIC
ncbi:MAG: bifunctional diguanylate cyclase/phosphodiesterase [Coprobacillus sp.]